MPAVEKPTVANELHDSLGDGNLLISQDYVRHTMLKVRDRPKNLAIGLMETMIDYEINHCEYTIIEGILSENKYGDMLSSVLKRADCVYAYYYNLSFEETVKRHKTKDYTDFDSKQMKDGFVPHDFLGLENEKRLSESLTKDDVIKFILTDLGIVG